MKLKFQVFNRPLGLVYRIHVRAFRSRGIFIADRAAHGCAARPQGRSGACPALFAGSARKCLCF